jgi:hypothetical protein
MRGQLLSHARRGRPLKNATARSRSDCEERLTNAHDDLEMRKMDDGPFQLGASGSLGKGSGTVALKYRHNSSCDVF